MNNSFKHRMPYRVALDKIAAYLGYEPVYIFEESEIKLSDLNYDLNEEVILSFDVENSTKINNFIDIEFGDGKKLTPLPF